ncbi:ATP-binding protein [Dyadobacter arcticus]|uniref:histidine kinase n=1 Tax=Dyadobacter arcticus TaxID=1078754 RepID=A0ABX0UND6_9BACT|nr:HAMP domain-containing sensor histidine kinase [Dyadobacter arcticus]NIJ52596.1 signal transduction histidine kinase [Dyadobacter arcticus]
MNSPSPLLEGPGLFDFTAKLAHEIRNPLATIDLSLELMLAERKDDDLKTYMDIIRHSADKINELVNDLIKNRSIVEAQVANQSLHHLLDEVIEMAKDRIMLKNIMVCKEYDPTDCIVALNRPKMKIALTNIIVNAIEAMEAQLGELKLVTMPIAGKYVVQIEDNGCGISEKNLKNIFHANYTNKPGGLGIGLASTYDILTANNVKVHVESQEGSGTHFFLLFDNN